jgi:hypothetical protein
MNTEKPTKINKLLLKVPSGVVLASKWLGELGYSSELIRNYKRSNWFESFGNGAIKRFGDVIEYMGAVYTMQNQMNMNIHPSAKTALILMGRIHYLEMQEDKVYLFAEKGEVLPTWFKNQDWKLNIDFITTRFLPPDLGIIEIDYKNYKVNVSSPARAMLECLYLVPDRMDLMECYQIMEGLTDLIPNQVQELLESCTSIKAKRLFLYLAEKSSHHWLNSIDIKKINLGRGNRSISNNGKFIAKYQLVVPKELEENELPEV